MTPGSRVLGLNPVGSVGSLHVRDVFLLRKIKVHQEDRRVKVQGCHENLMWFKFMHHLLTPSLKNLNCPQRILLHLYKDESTCIAVLINCALYL